MLLKFRIRILFGRNRWWRPSSPSVWVQKKNWTLLTSTWWPVDRAVELFVTASIAATSPLPSDSPTFFPTAPTFAPTFAPTATADDDAPVTDGAIAGIVIGAVVFACLFGGCVQRRVASHLFGELPNQLALLMVFFRFIDPDTLHPWCITCGYTWSVLSFHWKSFYPHSISIAERIIYMTWRYRWSKRQWISAERWSNYPLDQTTSLVECLSYYDEMKSGYFPVSEKDIEMVHEPSQSRILYPWERPIPSSCCL